MFSETFVDQMAEFMRDHLKKRLHTENAFGDIITMPKPRNKFESWGVWSEISSFLAPECITQDGQASEREQQDNIALVLGDAHRVFDMGYPCPKEIVEVCDMAEYLEQFLEEEDDG